MGILKRLFRTEAHQAVDKRIGRTKQQGALVHIFVFDSGPLVPDESKYVTTIARSLLPESMAYADVPISFYRDENMPTPIGRGRLHDLERATNYPFAWRMITQLNPALIEGLKVGKEHYTFACEEYDSERGNRGILYAFYEFTELK